MNDASSDEDTEDDDDEEGKVFSPSELRAKNERSRKRLEQKLRSMREDLYERTALEFREMEEVKARLLDNVRRLKEMHRDHHQTAATNGEEEEEDEDEDDREIERLEKQLEEEKEKQRRMLLREKEEGKKTT
tara:strand:- start:200 stop:595 length:396 start_codon:yes stop_codon:yes gene_type:complete